jgi:hypothetical protein
MANIQFKDIHHIKPAEIISVDPDTAKLAWVYAVIYEDKIPIGLKLLPMERRNTDRNESAPDPKKFREIPVEAIKAIGLPTPNIHSYFVSNEIQNFRPNPDAIFACYPDAKKTDFCVRHMRDIDDRELSKISDRKTPAAKPKLGDPPLHVKQAQKPCAHSVKDISFDDTVVAGIIALNNPLLEILKAAHIHRLGTAHKLLSADNIPKMRQIYDKHSADKISFPDFCMSIKTAWQNFLSPTESISQDLMGLKTNYEHAETVRFKFLKTEPDIAIGDAVTLDYFGDQRTARVLKKIGVATLRHAFELSSKETFAVGLMGHIRQQDPSAILEDIRTAFATFSSNVKEQPLDFPSDVQVYYPPREIR